MKTKAVFSWKAAGLTAQAISIAKLYHTGRGDSDEGVRMGRN